MTIRQRPPLSPRRLHGVDRIDDHGLAHTEHAIGHGLGRYSYARPPTPGLRQLRDPHSDDGTDIGEDG